VEGERRRDRRRSLPEGLDRLGPRDRRHIGLDRLVLADRRRIDPVHLARLDMEVAGRDRPGYKVSELVSDEF
jgi:hypothetical protein